MKVDGSYASLLQGVSEQTPPERGPGRCTEQVNMLPDPVHGLTRRHGTEFVYERATALLPADMGAMVADTANFRTFEYTNGGIDYVLLVRRASRPAGSTLPAIIVYDRTNKAFKTPVFAGADAMVAALNTNGAAAITAVGKFVFIAVNAWVSGGASRNIWDDRDQLGLNYRHAVAWIRGGAYNRTYSLTVTDLAGSTTTVSYTTPSANYPGDLDTRGVPQFVTDDPATPFDTDKEGGNIRLNELSGYGEHKLYWAGPGVAVGSVACTINGTAMTNVFPLYPTTAGQYRYSNVILSDSKVVIFAPELVGNPNIQIQYDHSKVVINPSFQTAISAITTAYNNAVSEWLVTAAEAVKPANIAQQLATQLTTAGYPATVKDSSVLMNTVIEIDAQDGGDGSLINGVANVITNVDDLTTIHAVGKIVKVTPLSGGESFYMKALPKNSGTLGWAEVRWEEAAGVEHTVENALIRGFVNGSNFVMGSSAAFLNAQVAGDYPEWVSSDSGDADTNPQAFFVGRQISWLGVFQDRLLIGAGATIRASRTADYLNVYRTSVLTVAADSAFEMLSQGSDDDTIRHGVLYDKDLILFGDRRQYVISGRVILAPTNASMPVLSQHPNTTEIPPRAIGNFIAYGQASGRSSAVHQIMPSQSGNESPESYNISSQLDQYLDGAIIEITDFPKPTHLLARASGNRNALYVMSYFDKPREGRVQDAWHRFEFASALGAIIGMARVEDGVLLFFLRELNGVVYYTVDLQTFDAGLSPRPYLDSIRQWTVVDAGTGSVGVSQAGWSVAFDDTTPRYMLGDALSNSTGLFADFPDAPTSAAWVGYNFPSVYTPTNPFVRDKNDKAITTGRLTVIRLLASLQNSSGFVTTLTPRFGAPVASEYNARYVGNPANIVGQQVVTDYQQSIPVGRETREHTLTAPALARLPRNFTSIERVGQHIGRTRRR